MNKLVTVFVVVLIMALGAVLGASSSALMKPKFAVLSDTQTGCQYIYTKTGIYPRVEKTRAGYGVKGCGAVASNGQTLQLRP